MRPVAVTGAALGSTPYGRSATGTEDPVSANDGAVGRCPLAVAVPVRLARAVALSRICVSGYASAPPVRPSVTSEGTVPGGAPVPPRITIVGGVRPSSRGPAVVRAVVPGTSALIGTRPLAVVSAPAAVP